MAIGDSYLTRIKGFEGFAPKAGWDYKQWTNGYGTRAAAPGEVIDRDEAERRFIAEIGKAENLVNQFAPNLDEGTRAALTSLTYNSGTSWMNAGLGEAVKAGDPTAIKSRLTQYVNAGGSPLPGLVSRRNAEAGWIGAAPDQSTSGVFDPATGQLGPKPLAMMTGAGREAPVGTAVAANGQTGADGDTAAKGLLDRLFGEPDDKGENQNAFQSLMAQVQPQIPVAQPSAAPAVQLRPVDPAQLVAIVQRRQRLGSA